MKKIKLTQNQFALVDDEDYQYLNQLDWHIHISNGKKYVSTTNNGKFAYMHRLIMNTPKNMVCDHKDNNGLNNQKSNLRNCNQSQNCGNSNNTKNKKYKGLYKNKLSNRIYARIMVNRITIKLGGYSTEKEAAEAYNKAALYYFGEYAKLNIIK